MKKWFSILLVVSLFITLLAPIGVYAAPSTTISDALGQTPTQTNIVKKNIYEENLNDVCYYSDDEHFYAIGDAGTLLNSSNGTDWSPVTDADIVSSSTVDFVAMECSEANQIAIIGNDTASQNTNYVYIKENNGPFMKTNLSTESGANGTDIRVNDIVVDNNNMFIVTDNRYIYRSVDYGDNWRHISITSSGNYHGAKSITRNQSKYMIFNNSSPSDNYQYYFSTTTPGTNTWPEGQFTSKFPGTLTDTFFGADDKWYALSNNGTTGYVTSFLDGGNPVSPTAGYIPLGGFSSGNSATIIVGYKDNNMIIRSSADQYQNQNQLHNYNSASSQLPFANVGPGKLHAVTGANISGTWTYVAVGTSGTILKSTNGYLFTPVAQTADTTKTISHYAIHPNTSGSYANNTVAITSDKKVYFSENGSEFIEWNNVNLKGEVIAVEFPNTNNAKVFVGTVDSSTNTSYVYSIEYGVATETPYTDFIASGYSIAPNGIALLGANAAGRGKIVTSTIFPSTIATFDGTNNRASYGQIHLITKIDNPAPQGTQYFSIVGTNIYYTEWNNPTFPNSYNIANINPQGLGKSYKKYARSGTEHLFMDETGSVMVLSSLSFNQAQIRKTEIYTGVGIGLTNFQLKELLSVNDVFFTLSQSGNVSLSYDGIMWSDVAALSSQSVADIDKKGNNLIVTLTNGTVKTFNIPYSPKVEETYTHYPIITLSSPSGPAYDNVLNTNIMQFNATSDPAYNDTRRTFNWYTEDQGQLTEILAAAGEDHFDIGTLPGGTHNIVAKVTHTDTTKLDRTVTERLYGPFTYTITERVFDLSTSYSDTAFEAIENYTSSDVQPIVLTLNNTGNIALNDITISSSDTNITASSSSTTLAVNGSTTINLTLNTGLALGTYTTDITVASANSNFTPKTETITISILEPPVYDFSVTATGTNHNLPYNYSTASDAKGELTLTNTGNRNITNYEVILSDTANFALGTLPTSIPIGQSANIDIHPLRVFNPEDTYTYTVDIKLNGTTVNTQTFTVEVAPIPDYAFSLTQGSSLITLEEGYSSSTSHSTIMIENIGNMPLTDITASLGGTHATSFTLDPDPIGSNLLPADSLFFTIKPVQGLTEGQYDGEITVTAATYTLTATRAFTLFVIDEPIDYSFTGYINSNFSSDGENLYVPYDYASTNNDTFEFDIAHVGNAPANVSFSTANSNVLSFLSKPHAVFPNITETVTLRLSSGLTAGTHNLEFTMNYGPSFKTFPFAVTVGEQPVYELTVSATNPNQVTVGYDALSAKFNVNVENTGNLDVTAIQFDLSDLTNFDVGAYQTSLTVGSSFSTEVSLNRGLPAGTYPLTLTITADNGITHTITKSFTVSTANTPSPSPSPSPGTPPPDTTPGTPSTPSPSPVPNIPGPNTPSTTQATVTEANQAVVSQLVQNGLQIVGEPIQVNLIDANNSNANIDHSQDYVQIELDATGPFTTVVFIDENGHMHHVPTLISDNKVIASVTRTGVYALVNLNTTFTDIINHWAENLISNLANRGIVNGTGNGQYSPNQEVTRAEFTAILVRALGLSYSTDQVDFNDVANNAWYKEAIQIATSYGLITGNPDGSFGPNDKITREQAMVILARVAQLNNLTAQATSIIDQYEDSELVSNYAKDAANTSVQLGLINGVSNTQLAPKANLTRAEIVAVIERLLKMAGLIN